MTPELIVTFIAGLILLLVGAEVLVRGAAYLSQELGIAPLVVGLTVVAFGTSSPELAVSLNSVYTGEADISVGNIVGSNILNILLVLGIASVITPMRVSKQILKQDLPLVILISVLTYFFAMDMRINRWEGAILFSGLIIYIIYLMRKSSSLTAFEEELPEESQSWGMKISWLPEWLYNITLVAIGLGMLILGSRWLVTDSVIIARYFGISELVIGLTVISIGTSLPEIATSVLAGLRKKKDIAVGNVVGSNLFNLMMVLGLTSLISPHGLDVSATALHIDIPYMIAIAVIAYPIFFTNWAVDRWEGFLFLLLYVGYTYYIMQNAVSSPHIDTYNEWILYYATPLLGLLLLSTFAIGYYRQIFLRKNQS